MDLCSVDGGDLNPTYRFTSVQEACHHTGRRYVTLADVVAPCFDEIEVCTNYRYQIYIGTKLR
jgi:hypothetical protein